MATLAQLITPHLDKTDAEIVALLNAASVERTDDQLWTWGGLNDRFDPTMVGTIAEVLAAMPGTKAMQFQLINPGVDFSLDKTQEVLDGLRAVPQLAPYIDALKAIGRWSESPWQAAGNSGDVTIEQVAESRTVLEAESQRTATEQRATTVWNEIVNPAVSEGKTWAEIIGLLVADEGGNP